MVESTENVSCKLVIENLTGDLTHQVKVCQSADGLKILFEENQTKPLRLKSDFILVFARQPSAVYVQISRSDFPKFFSEIGLDQDDAELWLNVGATNVDKMMQWY